MKRNLFDIQAEYLEYLEELEQWLLDNEDADGEIPEYIQERLNINKNEVEDKLGNYHLWLSQLKGEVDTLKTREEELKKKRKTKENTMERVRKIMGEAVKMYGEVNIKSKSTASHLPKSIKTEEGKFTFIYQDKLVIDEEILPVELFEYEIKTSKLHNSTALVIQKILQEAKVDITITATPDKDAIKTSIEEKLIPKGVTVNNNDGYIRIS
jgi:hypothetical protein